MSSKCLEALKRIALKDFIFNDDSSLNDIKIIKQELEALEIIKKYVDIRDEEGDLFKYSIVDKQYISSGSILLIDDEEYDLLKEVLL